MDDIQEIKSQVKDIHRALIGDEYHEKGLIHKVSETEKRVDKHDKLIWLISGGCTFLIFFVKYFDKMVNFLK